MLSRNLRTLTISAARTNRLLWRSNTVFSVQTAAFGVNTVKFASQRKRRPTEKERRELRKALHEEQTQKDPTPLPEPEVPYTPEDLIPGPGMLKRIVRDLENLGNKIILPNDTDLQVELASGLQYLCDIGVRPEFLLSACSTRSTLFTQLTKNGSDSIAIMKVLVETCAFTFEDAVRMMARYFG